MSTNPSTKVSVIWPGATGQLTSGSGTAVTVGSGLDLTSGKLTASSVTINASNSFAVGDAVYFNGSTWAKAQSNASATLGLAIVSACTGSEFTAQFSGPITGLSGLTAGQYYFVSDSSAGVLTATAPTSNTSYSNPLLFATSTSAGIVLPFRPSANGPAIVWSGTSSQLTAGDGTAVGTGPSLVISSGALTLQAQSAKVDTAQTTTSLTYTDLTTPGPAVTVSIGGSGTALVTVCATIASTSATTGWNGFASVAVSGSTTLSASDTNAATCSGLGTNLEASASKTFIVSGLTPGANTFTMKYRTNNPSGTVSFQFQYRALTVIPL